MAAGATYTPLATTTLGSATKTVDFTSISGSYTDLILICSVKASTADYLRLRVGSGSIDTGNNYSSTVLAGDGSTASSYSYSNNGNLWLYVNSLLSTSNYNVSIGHIMNYANTTTYKTVLTRGNEASGSAEATVGLWRNTSAINQIRVYTSDYNMAIGSTFTLYGVTAA